MPLSTALAIATSGLTVNSRELDLVAANIANADTVGYTKKSVSRQETVHNGQINSVIGTGIQRSIDEAAQQQYWSESAATTYASQLNDYLGRLDQLFGTPGGVDALDTMVNDFAQSLQKLGNSPDDRVAQLEVLNHATVLAEKLNSTSDSVQLLRQEAEDSLGSAVDSLNTALQDIERLDQKIRTISLSGEEPSGLMDQRDQLINQVSQLLDIKVDHLPENGVRITSLNGITLYDLEASEFHFDANTNVSAETKWSSDPTDRELGTIYLAGNGGALLDVTATNGLNGGKIGALLELRDESLVEAQAQLDELAAAMAEAFSSYQVSGTAATSGAQAGFELDLAALQAGDEMTLSYVDTSTGDTHVVSFMRVDSASALPLSDDVTARSDDTVVGIDFSGGMASVVSQIQAELGANFTVSNPSGDVVSILDDGAAGAIDINSLNASVTATSLQGTAGVLPMFVDAGSGPGVYTGALEGHGQKTGFASRITLNANLITDPSLLVKYDSSTDAADQTRPTALYNAFSDTSYSLVYKSGGTPVEMSIDEFSRQIITYQAEQAAFAKTRSEGQDIVMNNVQTRLEESSKVDVDAELAKLLELQTAYAANARVMSTVQEMLNALMQI